MTPLLGRGTIDRFADVCRRWSERWKKSDGQENAKICGLRICMTSADMEYPLSTLA